VLVHSLCHRVEGVIFLLMCLSVFSLAECLWCRVFVIVGSGVQCLSARLSVCPVDRQQLQLAAGLVLSILQAEDRLLIDSYGRRVPAIDRYLLPAQEQQMWVSSL